MDAKEALKVYFGYDSYKPGQEEIIDSILAGKDVLAIMPTGSGKSICYQVPALLLPGITIVISPLISLMQDQVKALNEAGIKAGYINSSLTESQISTVYSRALNGAYKILYVAPERLESYEFTGFAGKVGISMVTVDEAHCISQWGQDFRPSYLKIVDFIDGLSKRPIVSAFTATATEEVKNDISCVLKLQNPKIIVTGFDRENLYFDVETIKKKDDYVLEYIRKHPEDSGIIYCATRKNVDSLYELLSNEGIQVARYHAGMNNEDRKESQNDFIYDRTPVILATNAFGMGIDKSNVRFVIHYNMPQSMENYYQEAGRAGRDGEASQCILLFSAQDIMINKFLLDHKDFTDIPSEDIDLIRQRDVKRLQVMEGYCRTSGCLRNYIMEYFGEKRNEPCDSCGNCHREFTEIDMTEDAKLASQLLLDGYLCQTADKYSVIRLGNIEPLKEADAHVLIRTYKDREPERQTRSRRRRSTDSLTKAGYDLFEILRQLRLSIAREEGMPPYIVFSDKTLIDMSVKAPRDRSSMLGVSGVGEAKYEKYGERFIEAIAGFVDENPDSVTSIKDEEDAEDVKVKSTRKRKSRKGPFYLNPEDEEKFEYRDICLLGEIKDELNRITSGNNVKHIFGTDIYRFLTEKGYVEEQNIDGRFVRVPTEAGQTKGIAVVEQTSKIGTVYTVLKYPPAVQKEIVEHYIEIREQVATEDEEDVPENTSFDRAAYNRKMNRPDGAGASWSEEEDKLLDEEFDSGMKISEMAKIHDRTNGAIRARLRKHGLID